MQATASAMSLVEVAARPEAGGVPTALRRVAGLCTGG